MKKIGSVPILMKSCQILDINIFRFVVPVIIILFGFKILLSRNDDKKVSGKDEGPNQTKE